MAEFQFVGDLSDLKDKQKEFIAEVVKEQGFGNVNIDVQAVGEIGDNYASNVKRITVEKDGKTLKMIAKIAPDGELLRMTGNIGVLFENEHVMYTQVFPKFTELEEAANIPKEERFRYATCYGTYMEENNELILLEDLAEPGFKLLDKITLFTDDNVRMVLKKFAAFHTLSYALKYQEPEMFETFGKRLVNFWLSMGDIPEVVKMFEQLDADVQLIINDNKYKKLLKNAVSQVVAQSFKMSKIYAGSKHSVIQQGDAWINNIMFRLEVRIYEINKNKVYMIFVLTIILI